MFFVVLAKQCFSILRFWWKILFTVLTKSIFYGFSQRVRFCGKMRFNGFRAKVRFLRENAFSTVLTGKWVFFCGFTKKMHFGFGGKIHFHDFDGKWVFVLPENALLRFSGNFFFFLRLWLKYVLRFWWENVCFAVLPENALLRFGGGDVFLRLWRKMRFCGFSKKIHFYHFGGKVRFYGFTNFYLEIIFRF